MEIALVIGGIVVVVGGIVAAAVAATRRRREGLQAEAARLGFSFSPDDEEWLRKELAPFHLFSRGHSKRISNVLRGKTSEVAIAVFDYRYTTGGGQSSSTHSQTVLLFESPAVAFPAFSLRPEHIFHRIGQAFGYQDIDFDDYPQFSKQYLLQAEDDGQVRRFFTPAALQHFTDHKGICVEAAAGRLIIYRSGKKVAPAVVETFIRDGVYLYALLTPK